MGDREGFDLFHKFGRKHIWKHLKRYKSIPNYFWGDTFGRFGCWILGHKKYLTENKKHACYRCHKYLH